MTEQITIDKALYDLVVELMYEYSRREEILKHRMRRIDHLRVFLSDGGLHMTHDRLEELNDLLNEWSKDTGCPGTIRPERKEKE